jgi:hypothetical protein
MPRPLIALRPDGVLLDFHLGHANGWGCALGIPLERVVFTGRSLDDDAPQDAEAPR